MSEARKVGFGKVEMWVTPRFEQTGSIGADDAESRLLGIETKLELESEADREVVAGVVARAEKMCFLMDAVRNPHELHASVSLNGAELSAVD